MGYVEAVYEDNEELAKNMQVGEAGKIIDLTLSVRKV